MVQNNNTALQPLVSFIITAYNLPAERLTECVDSVLRLSLRSGEREVILVDDGSAGCLLAGMMPAADSIIYVRQPNGGTGAARNMGLRLATGRYIQFVDGEDMLLSEAYEHCIDIVRYNHPDIVTFSSGTTPEGRNDYEDEAPTDGSRLVKHNSLEASPWGYVFSRRILTGLRFNADCYADDEFTTLLFLRAEKVYSTSSVAYCCRRPPVKIDRTDLKAIVKRLDDAESLVLRLHDLLDTLSADDRSALQRRVAELTMNYIINTIRWTRSSRQLLMRVERLEQLGLFPLPDRSYSKKYVLFNKLSRSSLVRKILTRL